MALFGLFSYTTASYRIGSGSGLPFGYKLASTQLHREYLEWRSWMENSESWTTAIL